MARQDAASSTYAKQSRLRLGSGTRGVLLFAVAGLISMWAWGWAWAAKVCFGVAAFFLFTTTIEWANALFLERQKRRTVLSMPPQTDLTPNSDFEFLSTDDEGDRFERRILIEGHPIMIRIPSKLMEELRPYANSLIDSLGQLASRFQQFKSREADRNPLFAQEIRALEIGLLCFERRKTPNLIEVYFTEASGGEPWVAQWDQDSKEFLNLRMET